MRRDYESETDEKKPKRVEIPARKVDGIGPINKEGIPIVLRSVRFGLRSFKLCLYICRYF